MLTTVDIESEHQRAAKQAFTEAGIATDRLPADQRLGAEVLPRLRDAAYDLVFVDADKSAYAVYYEQAVRLLRPGGVLAFDNALWHDRVADPRTATPRPCAARPGRGGPRRRAAARRAAASRRRTAGRREAVTTDRSGRHMTR